MEKIKIGKETFNADKIQSLSATSWNKDGETKNAVKVTLCSKSINKEGYLTNDVVFVMCQSAEEAQQYVNS